MSQTALALDVRPPVTNARALRGVLRFDSEAMAASFIQRHGDLHTLHRNSKTTLRMKPYPVREEWLLVSWWSGHPYALNQKRVPQKINARDLR